MKQRIRGTKRNGTENERSDRRATRFSSGGAREMQHLVCWKMNNRYEIWQVSLRASTREQHDLLDSLSLSFSLPLSFSLRGPLYCDIITACRRLAGRDTTRAEGEEEATSCETVAGDEPISSGSTRKYCILPSILPLFSADQIRSILLFEGIPLYWYRERDISSGARVSGRQRDAKTEFNWNFTACCLCLNVYTAATVWRSYRNEFCD